MGDGQADGDNGLIEDAGRGDCYYGYFVGGDGGCYCYSDVKKPSLGYLLDRAVQNSDILNSLDQLHRQRMLLQGILQIK